MLIRPTVDLPHYGDALKITFGSCYGLEDMRNEIFGTISGIQTNETRPDVFIWGGDATYVDKIFAPLRGYERIRPLPIIESKFKVEYPFMREMRELGTQVIGVWDDHDFGVNDGGMTFIYKNYTREWFLDFLEEPSDSIRR